MSYHVSSFTTERELSPVVLTAAQDGRGSCLRTDADFWNPKRLMGIPQRGITPAPSTFRETRSASTPVLAIQSALHQAGPRMAMYFASRRCPINNGEETIYATFRV